MRIACICDNFPRASNRWVGFRLLLENRLIEPGKETAFRTHCLCLLPVAQKRQDDLLQALPVVVERDVFQLDRSKACYMVHTRAFLCSRE